MEWLGGLLNKYPELAVFLAIASEIGTLEALGIMLAGSLAGAAVIRSAGREARSRFGGNTGGRPLEVAMPGFMRADVAPPRRVRRSISANSTSTAGSSALA